jgi:anti-anti-sigma factor
MAYHIAVVGLGGAGQREDATMNWEILELKTPWPLVNVEEEDGQLVVRIHAEGFLWPSVDEIGTTLLKLVDEVDGDPFVLDFSNVDYMTGAGLEKLVHLHNKLQKDGRQLMINNVNPCIVHIFAITGLAEDFVVNPSSIKHPELAKIH